MKRVTIALDEKMYLSLIEYAAEKSKKEMRRFSLGEAIRDLIASQLGIVTPTEKVREFKRTA